MNREDSTRIFGMYNYLTISLWWFVFLSPILSLTAQTNLSWNKTLGGNGFEELQTMIETEDGNFVFFGSHTSDVSGDITQGAYGLSDYWLAKVDQSNGNIIWQNTYGGNLIDNGRVMVSTSDGGFLLGGHSSTGINGTKTTTAFGACWNCIDYWVVKTDADGNQLWDKTIQGSSMRDRMTTLIETSDGGFVLAGYSDSDLALDKSEANIGGSDYWVVKLDADGNQLWDRTLGGTGDEQPFALVELPNGTILVGGLSFSLNDGNRTAPSRGLSDYWVVNLDANGTILWDQAYGGTDADNLRDMILTNDGGVILIGESYSGAGGEKTAPSYGERDIWMLKIDVTGSLLWDRSIGSTDRDQPFKITQSPNGNFLIASLSKSPAGFDRTEPSLGGADYWFVTTDANGNKIKDAVFGGDQNDNLYYALPMRNGDIILGGITATDTSPQKTEPSRGNNDLWLVKYESTLDFDLGNDTIFCVDGTLNLDVTINPCDCCVYTWEDGSSVANRNLMIDQDTTIILSVHDGFNSLRIDTINVTATEPLTINLGPDTYLCAGDSILLDAENPGQNYFWLPGNAITQDLLITTGDTYQVTVTDQFGCSYEDEVIIRDMAVPVTTGNPIICAGDSLFLANAWQTTSGMYIDTLNNFVGCDSIVMTDLFVATVDTTRLFANTCVESEAGVFSMTMDNQYFCDSTVITTVTYIEPDTTHLFSNTCVESEAGISSMTMDNQYFCDSTVINTVTYIAPDTTRLFANTCVESEAGIFSMTMDNQYFCDSTVINTVTYIAPDTTRLFANTCVESEAGIFSMTMDNQYFCDSTVINTVTYIAPDTTRLFSNTCVESEAGISSMTMDNQYFCDSTIITTVTYIAPDTTRLFSNTCVESEAGISSMTMDNQYFCDSTVINTVTYIAPDTTRLFANTCVESEAGIFSMTMDNQYFCDSTVINTVTYIAPDTTRLFANTCVESEAGIFSMTMDNQYFCDSTVINTVTYIAPDTTRLFVNTCVESEAGVFFMTVDNQYACDSTIINTVTYVPMDTIRLFTNTCNENEAGIFSETTNNQDGCDSTIINTVTYIAPDTVNLTDFTCDENQAGPMTFQDTNIFGCDSTTIIDFIYIAPDTTELESHTCDPAQAGPQVVTEVNSQGCDSVVITTNIYVLAEFINQTANTCDPAQAGITMDTLKSQYGCDSLITTTTIDYFAPDTTIFSSITCDSTLMRIDVENLTGFRGCDSTVITQVDYFAPQTATVLLETCDPAQAGSVTNIISGQAGCDSIITITETIYRGSENTLLSATSCDPDLTGTETNVFTNQFGCDSTVILTTTLSMADTTYLNMVSCNPDSLGTDSLIFTNQGGCDSIVYTVTIAENLGVDYELTDASCSDAEDGSILVNEVTNGLSPYLFAIDDGSFQSFALFPRLAAGSYTLWVQDADGCTAPYEFDIQAPPPLTVSLPNDTTINVGSFLTLPATTNQAVDTVFWNESSGINCDSSSCLRPEVQPFSNSVYIVTVANGDGCSASDTTLVNVSQEKPFYIPTAFSPNQDGINDDFVLSPGPNVTMIHSVRIFNRWGALLFELPETLPLQSVTGWDGQFKGQPVTSGVYIYMVDVSFIDGERKIITGDVTVFR